MTTEELLAREAIRATMARYNMAGDRLRIDDYVACFTDDGVMEAEHRDPSNTFRYAGRAAIRAWQQRWLDHTKAKPAGAGGVHQASFARHHLSTCEIELTGFDTARARTYWVAWTDIGPDHAGVYIDSFRRVGEAWLIAHRKVREDWRSPQSLFNGAVDNSR
jgi:hypothetical protein